MTTFSMTDTPRAGRAIVALGALSAVLLAVATFGVFLVAPEDADSGVIQRIFYFHVSVALVSMLAFMVACIAGIVHLRRGGPGSDDVGVSSIGIGLMLALLTVITGSIWAKAAWGFWWRWDDLRLVSFLLIILLYAAYFVLRGSADDSRQARFGAVYAIFAFAAVPLSFYAVRTARSFIHPVVVTSEGADMPGTMLVWFVLSVVAFTALFVTLLLVEVQQRRAARALEDVKRRLEAAPHTPTGGQ